MTESTPSTPQELIDSVRAARAGSVPVSPALPDLCFSGPDSGVLDLMVVIEQVIRTSGGATVAQVLHGVVYLLAMAHENILNEIPQLREQLLKRMPAAEIEEAALRVARRHFEAEAAQLKNCLSVITSLLEMPTTMFIKERTMEARRSGRDQSKAILSALVGSSVLDSLELDQEAYYSNLNLRV